MLEDPYEEYKPQPGTRFWKWTLVGWLFVVGLFGAGMAKCASGAEVYRGIDNQGGPAVLTLQEQPCTNAKVLAKLYEQFLDDRRFKASTLLYHGKEWASCWVERRGTVHSMDEEGAPFQPIPRRLFRDESV